MRPLLESPVELAGLARRSETANGFKGGATLEGDALKAGRDLGGARCALFWGCDCGDDDTDAEEEMRLDDVLSGSAWPRGEGEISICGSSVEDLTRPPRAACGCCRTRELFELDFGSEGVAPALARSPPPVNPPVEPTLGMRVEDRCLAPGAGREGDEVGGADVFAVGAGAPKERRVPLLKTGESGEEDVAGVAGEGDELP